MSSEEDNYNEEECDYYCDTCDREFDTEEKYELHISEHTVCGLDGCKFTAHEKIVQKHIEMQHKSGLYEKLKKLETPEDIAKWIEERKKNYPNKENIELRRQKQEEMLKRGELLGQNKSRFGRKNETRAAFQHRKVNDRRREKQRTRRIKKVNKIKFSFDDKSDWNGNLPPFRGTSVLYEKDETDSFSDDEWGTEQSLEKSGAGFQDVKETVPLNNALGALMSNYNSSDYSDNEEIQEITNLAVPSDKKVESISVNEHIKNNDLQLETDKLNDNNSLGNDCEVKIDLSSQENTLNECISSAQVINEDSDEAPTEVKIEKYEIVPPVIETVKNIEVKRNRKRKRFNNRKGRKTNSRTNNDENSTTPQGEKRPKNSFNNIRFKRRKVTLLEKLLEKDIIHERNVILQCVKYIVKNNFFDRQIVPNIVSFETNQSESEV